MEEGLVWVGDALHLLTPEGREFWLKPGAMVGEQYTTEEFYSILRQAGEFVDRHGESERG